MLFKFWEQLPPGETVHPADRAALEKYPRMFEVGMPPGQINGPLRTAPVVACFVNPGFDNDDRLLLEDPAKRQLLLDQIDGAQPFPIWIPGWRKWFLERVGKIGLPEQELARTVATFNACAYASKNTEGLNREVVKSLPSTQIARRFLHEVLVPKARAREIFLVFCRGNWAWEVEKSIESENIRFAPNPTGAHFGEPLSREVARWLGSRHRET